MPNLVTKKDECRTDEHDREHTSAPLQIKEIPDKNQSQNVYNLITSFKLRTF